MGERCCCEWAASSSAAQRGALEATTLWAGGFRDLVSALPMVVIAPSLSCYDAGANEGSLGLLPPATAGQSGGCAFRAIFLSSSILQYDVRDVKKIA